MSDKTEALARALCEAGGVRVEDLLFPLRVTRYGEQAERILADPGPLLEALAVAGVLEVEENREPCEWLCDSWNDYHGETCGWRCRRYAPHDGEHECVDGHHVPVDPAERQPTCDTRYVTKWQEVDR